MGFTTLGAIGFGPMGSAMGTIGELHLLKEEQVKTGVFAGRGQQVENRRGCFT